MTDPLAERFALEAIEKARRTSRDAGKPAAAEKPKPYRNPMEDWTWTPPADQQYRSPDDDGPLYTPEPPGGH